MFCCTAYPKLDVVVQNLLNKGDHALPSICSLFFLIQPRMLAHVAHTVWQVPSGRASLQPGRAQPALLQGIYPTDVQGFAFIPVAHQTFLLACSSSLALCLWVAVLPSGTSAAALGLLSSTYWVLKQNLV